MFCWMVIQLCLFVHNKCQLCCISMLVHLKTSLMCAVFNMKCLITCNKNKFVNKGIPQSFLN